MPGMTLLNAILACLLISYMSIWYSIQIRPQLQPNIKIGSKKDWKEGKKIKIKKPIGIAFIYKFLYNTYKPYRIHYYNKYM